MVLGWVSREPICKGITTSLGKMEKIVFSSPPSRKSGLYMFGTRAELLEIMVRVSPADPPPYWGFFLVVVSSHSSNHTSEEHLKNTVLKE